MNKRHIDTITSRLEDVFLHGCTHITDEELRYWYSRKISTETNRDLEARWQTITKNEKGRLMKVKGRSGIFLFSEQLIEPVDITPEKTLDRFR